MNTYPWQEMKREVLVNECQACHGITQKGKFCAHCGAPTAVTNVGESHLPVGKPLIHVEVVPHQQQRYDTVGDYLEWQDGNIAITVSDLGDWRYEFLVAIHEQIEVALARHRGIREEDIRAFDTGDGKDLEDPGHDPRCPCHKEHVFAEIVERLVAQQLDVNWQAYDVAVFSLHPEKERV